MISLNPFYFLLSHRKFYESLDHFPANPNHFQNLVRPILPESWQLERRGVWFYCTPPDAEVPPRGWKIHLSATLGNAPAILTTAARLFHKNSLPFKFALDKTIFMLMNGKRWPRGGAGKFITAYPKDRTHCQALLEELRVELVGYNGPYILSDRRFRDSSVVHYRYGGFHPIRRLQITGKKTSAMQTSEGTYEDEERAPTYTLPKGVPDLFDHDDEPLKEGDCHQLKDGRYEVVSAIAFSNSGGVYLALDHETNSQCVIKEARPFTSISPQGYDAVWLLKKQHRLLQILADTNVAPQPVDFFKDWEHYYLVQDYFEGMSFRHFFGTRAICLQIEPSYDAAREFFNLYLKILAMVAESVAVLHGKGIVVGDISHYNVLIDPAGEEIRLIDFEGAHEEGVDLPTPFFTPGFASANRFEEGTSSIEDDLFAFGGLMLAGLHPINNILNISPRGHRPFLRAMIHDIGLPVPLAKSINALLSESPSERPKLREMLTLLKAPHSIGRPNTSPPELSPETLASTVREVLDFVEHAADLSRSDRLFPADPTVFVTNPLSIAYGACGVLYALNRVKGEVPHQFLDWVLRQPVRQETYPPGLYVGLAGVAWTLLELGLPERARTILELARSHPLLKRCPDLFDGIAGWGLTELRFFLETLDEEHLDQACQAGRFLVSCRKDEDVACYWPVQDEVCCGLAHGVSGISLFLLYLYLATRDDAFLGLSRRGLEFVARRSVRTREGSLTWKLNESHPTTTPYWRWGSAGVGAAVLRYTQVDADPGLQSMLRDLSFDVGRKYSIFPGRFFGLAGMGDFMLDLVRLGTARQVEAADRGLRKVLAGIQLFQLEEETGIAFPGESLSRISCDYGTGGVGIALFLHRILTRAKPDFLLDELLEPSCLEAELPRQQSRLGGSV